MNLFRKIKNIKRHKRNKRLRNLADNIFTEARYGVEMIVSSRIYNIIYFRNSPVPSNIKEFGGIKNDLEIITVPKEVMNFYDNESLRYEEWFGISRKESFPDIPSAYPKVFAPKLDTIRPKLGE